MPSTPAPFLTDAAPKDVPIRAYRQRACLVCRTEQTEDYQGKLIEPEPAPNLGHSISTGTAR